MSAMQIALSRVTNAIPRDILEAALKEELDRRRGVGSIQTLIESEIIDKIVRSDVNLMGGKPKEIVLLQEHWVETAQNAGTQSVNMGNYAIYRIPPEERDDLPLVEVSGLSYPGHAAGFPANYGYGFNGVTLESLANQVLESHTFTNSPARPTVELMGGDMVRLNPPQFTHINWILRCRIAFDRHFTTMSSSSKSVFAQLCVEAAKNYCYQRLALAMNGGKIQFGATLDTFTQIVESYAEADARYIELLDQFAGTSILDPGRLAPLLRHMVN